MTTPITATTNDDGTVTVSFDDPRVARLVLSTFASEAINNANAYRRRDHNAADRCLAEMWDRLFEATTKARRSLPTD